MKTTLILALLASLPCAALAGNTSSTGAPAAANSVVVSVVGTGPGGIPVGACVATATSTC